MFLRYIRILTLVLNTSFVWAQTTNTISSHSLQAQLARTGVQRLETEELSKSAYKKLRSDVLARCSDVQLGAMDIWFGDSVVTWARVLLLDGDWLEARSVLLGQAEVLQNIEKNIRAHKIPVSTISPLAGCRYFLGETYRIEYEKTGQLDPAVEALKHYYNVYIKYGPSPWGEAAQEKAEAAKRFVESRGRQVRINLGSHRAAFLANQFKLGARLIKESRYDSAIDPILNAINYFPETEKSPEALRNLGLCFLNLDREEEALMTVEYLCERFSFSTNAPAAVLAIGRRYLEKNDDLAGAIFENYLAAFPEDSHRADLLSHFAWKAYAAGKSTEAIAHFHAVEVELRRWEKAGEALEKAVYIQAECSKSIAAFDRFLAEFPASELTLRARVGVLTAAIEARRFNRVERELAREEAIGGNVYFSVGEQLLLAEEFRLAGLAFGLVKPATARSRFGIASAQFGRATFRECVQTLENLLADFPIFGRFYDARLMQARALVQLGKIDDALVAYGEVVVGRPDYGIIFEMAERLPDREDQLAAFQRIVLLANPDKLADRLFIAKSIVVSLPLCFEMQKYQVALDSCDQFELIFPQHNQRPTVGQYRTEAEHALVH